MTKQEKIRLDVLLAERGLAPSRQRAQALILAGQVVVGDHACTKAGERFVPDVPIRLKGDPNPYVSRGGLKLQSGLEHYGVDPVGFVCLDVGASTGGFTDCLLQRGAQKVYALDVGTNQLDYRLRSDPRVICWERTHVKELGSKTFEETIDLIVMDVSFISMRQVLPYLFPLMHVGAGLLGMVKPQFEVGRERVGKGGVVRDPALQAEAVESVRQLLREEGFSSAEPFPSAVKGPKGNQEWFVYVPGNTKK